MIEKIKNTRYRLFEEPISETLKNFWKNGEHVLEMGNHQTYSYFQVTGPSDTRTEIEFAPLLPP